MLKHLCPFPLPQRDLGITVVSVLQNTRVAQRWGGRGHISVRRKVWEVNLRIFPEIQEKRYLFQRFVTSIVVYKTFWMGCLVTTYESKEIFKAGVHLKGKVKVFILRRY